MTLKIWCEECRGNKGSHDINFKDNVYFVKCKACQGKGYIEREVKAEDLSVEEQRDIASHWYGDFLEGKVDFNDPINSWKGMGK